MEFLCKFSGLFYKGSRKSSEVSEKPQNYVENFLLIFITEIMKANIDLVFCSQYLLVEGSQSPQTFPLISVWWHETDNWRPQGFVDIHISTEM